MSKLLSNNWRILALSFFGLIILLGLITVKDYGMSWDEPFRFKGGDAKLAYYEALFSGEPRPQMSDNYPGLFDLPLAAFRKHFPGLGLATEQGHVWSLCFGLLGLAATWRLVAQVGGERAGFWALLLLVATPRYYGHMFFNPKDIPFAATYMLALWALVRALKQLPDFSTWRAVVLVGFTAGLAMASRMAGLLLLFYFAVMIFCFLVMSYVVAVKRKNELTIRVVGSDLLGWAIRGALAGIIAYAVLLIFWPTGHANPFAKLGGAVGDAQSYGWSGRVLMDGFIWEAQDLPAYYMIYWLLVATPEYIILLSGLSAFAVMLWAVKCLHSRSLPQASLLWPRVLVSFAGIFPLVYMLIKQPVVYDGLRHFLFIVPVGVACSAMGLEWLLRQIECSKLPRLVILPQIVTLIFVAIVGLQMVYLHPYQYIYFNQASGGLPAALNRDETDYWGVSHKEAAEWLNQHIGSEADDAGEYKIYMNYTPWMLEAYLDERFQITHDPSEGDYSVSITRMNLHQPVYEVAEVLHAVERQGVALCYVFKLPVAHSENSN